jgi:Signal transduction histidine kinase
LHKLTRGALAEMRTMLMELRPNSIVNTDLSNLLRQMVEGLAGRTTAEILLQTEGVGLLPPEVQTAFFRITQEAINNILKHSKADRVTITYKNQKTMAYLCIEDNGCGFDPENVMVERMGVRIMRERAESINALFELTSMQTCGTKIEVNWIKPQSE